MPYKLHKASYALKLPENIDANNSAQVIDHLTQTLQQTDDVYFAFYHSVANLTNSGCEARVEGGQPFEKPYYNGHVIFQVHPANSAIAEPVSYIDNTGKEHKISTYGKNLRVEPLCFDDRTSATRFAQHPNDPDRIKTIAMVAKYSEQKQTDIKTSNPTVQIPPLSMTTNINSNTPLLPATEPRGWTEKMSRFIQDGFNYFKNLLEYENRTKLKTQLLWGLVMIVFMAFLMTAAGAAGVVGGLAAPLTAGLSGGVAVFLVSVLMAAFSFFASLLIPMILQTQWANQGNGLWVQAKTQWLQKASILTTLVLAITLLPTLGTFIYLSSTSAAVAASLMAVGSISTGGIMLIVFAAALILAAVATYLYYHSKTHGIAQDVKAVEALEMSNCDTAKTTNNDLVNKLFKDASFERIERIYHAKLSTLSASSTDASDSIANSGNNLLKNALKEKRAKLEYELTRLIGEKDNYVCPYSQRIPQNFATYANSSYDIVYERAYDSTGNHGEALFSGLHNSAGLSRVIPHVEFTNYTSRLNALVEEINAWERVEDTARPAPSMTVSATDLSALSGVKGASSLNAVPTITAILQTSSSQAVPSAAK